MKIVKVRIKREAGAEDLPLPAYQTSGSSGMDLYCAATDPGVIAPGQTRLVSTGISISLPKGFEAQVRPRSGLALKHGITLPNSPGTIDCDYRGIISVIMHNLGSQAFELKHGMRIAQLVIAPVTKVALEEVSNLDETARAAGGFGHTGH